MTKYFYSTNRNNILSRSGSENNGTEGALQIPQGSRSEASPSDGLMLYPGHLLVRGSYPSEEMQSVYSTAYSTPD